MQLSQFSYQCSAPNAEELDMTEHTDTGDIYTSVFNSWLKYTFIVIEVLLGTCLALARKYEQKGCYLFGAKDAEAVRDVMVSCSLAWRFAVFEMMADH